jgi:hypothetical protein
VVISRRGLLLGGAGAVATTVTGGLAVAHGLLPGRGELDRALGRCTPSTAPPPIEGGEPAESRVLASAARGRDVGWALALPPGVPPAGLPVVLVLHGRGGGARSAFDDLHLHHALAQHTSAGGRPFALVAADGGESYWHPRAGGDDPLAMLVHELLPLLREADLQVDRVGAWGWSMGGYGALLLARESVRGALAGTRVVAAAAASPALFPSFAEAAPGAFDDPADFAAWGDLVVEPGVSPEIALSVSCGTADPFAAATRRYRDAVRPEPAGAIDSGCHDPDYWRSRVPADLAFLESHLPP